MLKPTHRETKAKKYKQRQTSTQTKQNKTKHKNKNKTKKKRKKYKKKYFSSMDQGRSKPSKALKQKPEHGTGSQLGRMLSRVIRLEWREKEHKQ